MRAYLTTLGALAAGGALGLVAAGRPWGSAAVSSSFTSTTTTVTGGDLAPPLSAVPLVALAAVVLMPAVRGVGRRVVGAMLAMLGCGAGAVAVVVGSDLSGRVRTWIASAPDHSGPVRDVGTAPEWAYAAVLAAVLVAVSGAVVAVRGPRWPSMGARYERPDRRGGAANPARPSSDEARSGQRARASSPAEVWDALDRGDDPTA